MEKVGEQDLYHVRVKGPDTSISFLVEADDLIGAVMKAAEHVGKLNDGFKLKFPRNAEDEEFFIESVHHTELVVFNDAWLQAFLHCFTVPEQEEDD